MTSKMNYCLENNLISKNTLFKKIDLMRGKEGFSFKIEETICSMPIDSTYIWNA